MSTTHINESIRLEIDYYLSLDEQALLSFIGRHKPVAAIGRYPDDYELGIGWYEHAEVFFYGKLCMQNSICSKLEQQGFSDNVDLVLAIADAICGYITNIPPFAVAALLIKKGLRAFCHCGCGIGDERRGRILGHAVIWYYNLSHHPQYTERNLELFEDIKNKQNLCYSVIKTLYSSEYERLLMGYEVPVP